MCGIIGVFKHEGPANVEIYEGLLMLQHRGQDSAGVVTTEWEKFYEHKANGLVKDVFSQQATLDKLKGEFFRMWRSRKGGGKMAGEVLLWAS